MPPQELTGIGNIRFILLPSSSSTMHPCLYNLCKYLRDLWAKRTIYNSLLVIYAYVAVQFVPT